ncbi:MAG: glycosyltransferase family 2 protein [Pyrinomonadaceae bacterium]
MPAYNAERYVAESIQSVRAQTYGKWELLVVDDGSTDRTAEIVQGLAAADARIKYLWRTNGRQAKARNTGLKAASGELIAFLDADDLWVPDKLARQVAAMTETESDLVFSDGVMFDDDRKPASSRPFNTIVGKFAGPEMFKLLFAVNRIPILSVLVRREVLEAVHLFDEEPRYQNCEDYELWLKLARHGVVFYGMDASLVWYRLHPASMTANQVNALAPMIAVLKKYRHDERLSQDVVGQRLRDLYRAVVTALLKENRVGEAKAYVEDLSSWDKSAVTSLQKMLIRLAPGQYNFISHQFYRVGWRLRKMRRQVGV